MRSSVLAAGSMIRRLRNRSSARSRSSAALRPSTAPCRSQCRRSVSALASEVAQSEIATDALRLHALGRLTAGLVEEQHRREPKLAREMIDDRQRRRPVIVEETAVRAQHAELQREAPAMVVAAAARDFGE